MKIVNIHEENIRIFQTTWEISIKFSEKMCSMIILKITEKQGFTLSLENTVFWKPIGGTVVKLILQAFLGLTAHSNSGILQFFVFLCLCQLLRVPLVSLTFI